MIARAGAALAALLLLCAADNPPLDDAARFGAREDVANLSLSPDGTKVAYIAPMAGQGAVLFTLGTEPGAKPRVAATVSGAPDRLDRCNWVSDDRLVCVVYGVINNGVDILPFTRVFAVNADGSKVKLLSTRENEFSRGYQLGGGSVIDWLPDADGKVLMTRIYLPDAHLGSRVGSDREGLAVDELDTRTLAVKRVEPPERDTAEYISDGRGVVRIKAWRHHSGGGEMDTGILSYVYRVPGSRSWQKLSDYNSVNDTGFNPYAVDPDANVAYGFKKVDGRLGVYSVALDGSLREQLVFARPDVDVDGLIRIGRRNRVVGVSYATEMRDQVYLDPEIKRLAAALGKALPNQPKVRIVDSSVDEAKLLVFASSDQDAGGYYILDRKTHRMALFMAVRDALADMKLAKVRPVRYPAADGTMIPGYLTLPPGKEDARGLPAIVLPHGGPSARDEWGFDWLSQFYAARGYAVLQPNFRGSAGYGDAWFQQNGFRSWKIAIGDVLDAGRWLVKEGTADPAKLAIVGWSYGGYAALQSAVVDPQLFKAVIAIAPVTDLGALKEEHRNWSDFRLVSDFVGAGPHLREGSPAANANRIKAPVLLFHGALDRTVAIAESKLMDARLSDAKVPHQLVTWDRLDHYLEDSAARTEMLRKSDAFLRQAMHL